MNVVLLLIILAVLVLSHEFGHFLFAKLFGMKVEEFGVGLPPRAKGFMWRGTIYSFNWIPFGGFVRILGEDSIEGERAPEDMGRAFTDKSRISQAIVVVAGVIFNILFAIFLLWVGFTFVGLPVSTAEFPSYAGSYKDVKTVITDVVPDSPAAKAHLEAGKEISSLASGSDVLDHVNPETVRKFVDAHADKEITLTFSDDSKVVVVPDPLLGIMMDEVGLLKLGPIDALLGSARSTFVLTRETAKGIFHFLVQTFSGKGSLSDVVGPVGIAGLVGQASNQGFASLLFLTVILSITLAVVNCIPFPALDGGRLLFIIIEAIKGKPLKQKVAGTINAIGFALLILLMVVVTIHDISKLI